MVCQGQQSTYHVVWLTIGEAASTSMRDTQTEAMILPAEQRAQ